MKKVLSGMLVLTMMFSLLVPAVAAEVPTDEIIGEIFYESEPVGYLTAGEQLPPTTILSSVDNPDGSITIYEYENNVLIEAHTTQPGSGRIDSVYYDATGNTTTETEFTKRQTRADTDIPDEVHFRNLGYMHYRNTFTNTIFSINCDLREGWFKDREYTFNAGTSQRLGKWTAAIVSIFFFHHEAEKMAEKIVSGATSYGILEKLATGFYSCVLTRTIVCDYYNQEIHGEPTQPSGQGESARLDGVYAYVDYGSGPEVKTEGYTVRDWGNSGMGRQMMYKVFGIDEAPTSWSNVDLRALYG
ncbi:hypothetical protein [Clostridium phoceensis]|uniref:hypothetical protein n=1 Tax=Clostridium phoceensis TaxID=1650661 RepID=UPI000A9D17D0|nr:hypothetical protein [Clostridium phoceensis]